MALVEAFKPDVHVRLSRGMTQAVSVGALLNDYMTLPVEQYCVIRLPARASMTRMNDNEFVMHVPPLHLPLPGLPITIEPTCSCRVESTPSAVRISSNSCRLSGSPLIERLRLNDCFEFLIKVQLTWDSAAPRIRAETQFELDVATPASGGQRLVPRRVRELTVEFATGLVLDALLKVFMRNLAEDYELWASDSQYREERRAECESLGRTQQRASQRTVAARTSAAVWPYSYESSESV
jgi:hypothetical protein